MQSTVFLIILNRKDTTLETLHEKQSYTNGRHIETVKKIETAVG